MFEFFAELMEGAEMVGGGGDLQVAGFEELLVAAVEEAGDLSVEEDAGAGEELDGAVRRGGDLGGTAVFPYLEGLCGALYTCLCTLLGGSNIESLTAKHGEDVVEAARCLFLCHNLDLD